MHKIIIILKIFKGSMKYKLIISKAHKKNKLEKLLS